MEYIVGESHIDMIDSDAEKLIDYMELVREFDRDKLFVTVNMRGFFVDSEMAALWKLWFPMAIIS